MVIAVPIILILLMGMIDLGMMLFHYNRISSVAYEGIRFGSSLIGLDQDADAGGPRHVKIKDRVEKLLVDYGYTEDEVVPVVSYDPVLNVVEVSITAQVEPYFPMFRAFTSVVASAKAPYLYPAD